MFIEENLTRQEKIKCLIVLLITPIWITALVYVLITGEMLDDEFPRSSRIFFDY